MATRVKSDRDLSVPTPRGTPRKRALRSDVGIKKQPDLNAFRETKCTKNLRQKRKDRTGRPRFEVRFPPYLYDLILAEAQKRQISFNRVCIELMEAGLAP